MEGVEEERKEVGRIGRERVTSHTTAYVVFLAYTGHSNISK